MLKIVAVGCDPDWSISSNHVEENAERAAAIFENYGFAMKLFVEDEVIFFQLQVDYSERLK